MSDGGRSIDDVAMRLRALASALGYNQSGFAAMVGLTQPAMNNYMRGLRRPDLEAAIQIASRTGVTLDWLYLGDRAGLPARLLALLPDLSAEKRAG